jgi:uncharacterized OB-fold protein
VTDLSPTIDPSVLRLNADGSATLLGGRRGDGRLVFPCPAGDPNFRLEELPRSGRLWSWTVQRFRPKSPPYEGTEAFEPYAVGYVDLGEVIVEARLVGRWDAFRIGMPMTLVAERFPLATGEATLTFAYAPEEKPA